jgi:AraC-like DNA-binding protein
MTIHISLAPGSDVPGAPGGKWHDLVERAEALALADLEAPLHISALCTFLSVSERTLRKAFHRSRGLSPCRHLRMLRLSQAKRALLSADCNFVTVTEIATGFGFVELGRFSVEYRKVFGESPCESLRAPFASSRLAGPGLPIQGRRTARALTAPT